MFYNAISPLILILTINKPEKTLENPKLSKGSPHLPSHI